MSAGVPALRRTLVRGPHKTVRRCTKAAPGDAATNIVTSNPMFEPRPETASRRLKRHCCASTPHHPNASPAESLICFAVQRFMQIVSRSTKKIDDEQDEKDRSKTN